MYFLPGNNTVDAKEAVYNSQMGVKLYQGLCQMVSNAKSHQTWTVNLYSIYSIHNITFYCSNGNSDDGTFIMTLSNYNYLYAIV